MQKKIYIIGAGIAGLTSAYYLAKKGYIDISVFEASPNIGGRCRSYFDDRLQMEIDNGNHLILGANKNVMGIIKDLNIEKKFNKFDNKIFNFHDAENDTSYRFKAPFPNPKVFGFEGLTNFIKFVFVKKPGSVADNFEQFPQIYERLINPVSRSILNTDSESADAALLQNVFRKIIFSRHGFDYYYPVKNWNDSLILPLAERLKNRAVKIYTGKSLKEITFENDHAQKLIFDDKTVEVGNSKVVLAVPSNIASKLADIEVPDEFNAIANIHFSYKHNLKPQIIGMIHSNLIEWIFVKQNLISTTFSAANNLNYTEGNIKSAWELCCKALKMDAPSGLPQYKVINEKRATFTCTAEQLKKRPSSKTKYYNLFLAGDYTQTGLPATIEGAVVAAKKMAKSF